MKAASRRPHARALATTASSAAHDPGRAPAPAPLGAADAAAARDPLESLQGTSLALARILGRLVTALEQLLGEDGRRALAQPPDAGPPAEILRAIQEEVRLAREALAPLQGTGEALLPAAARAAHAQQRADPAHSPHFGG